MAMVVELLASVVLSETTRRVYKFVRNKNFVPKTIIGEDYEYVTPSTDQQQPVHHRPIIREVVQSSDEEAGKWWKKDSVAFGPYYRGLESDTWKTAKYEAWNHVLRTSNEEGGESERYVEAVRAVEREARGLYSEKVMSSLSSNEFIWIMILDGCFLLQVALFVLGGPKELDHPIDFFLSMDHPIDDPTFGHPGKKALIRAAISSMFIVGNQIPSLVLKELMKQSFFKRVFNRGIWHQPLDFQRCVLFKLLLVPLLDSRSRTGGRGPLLLPTAWLSDYARLKKFVQNLRSCKLVGIVESRLFSLKLSLYPLCNKVPSEDANDLLHGLWLLVTGLKTNSKGNETDNVDPDIENIIGDGISSIRCGDYFDDIVLPSVRSATELKEAGVGFKCNRNGGTTNIKFKNVFNAFLYLPQVTIDCGSSEFLLRNLMDYEVAQGFGEKRRQVCAYLQLMRDLLRSPEDAKVLARSGVILVDPKQEEQLPKLFQELSIPKVKPNNSLNKVRNEVTNFTQPNMFKQKLSDILNFVILLTVIQTVYTVLTFHLSK